MNEIVFVELAHSIPAFPLFSLGEAGLLLPQPYLANTLVILAVLVATSLYDLKKREVPDWAWGSLLVWAVVAGQGVMKWSPVGWLSLVLGLVCGLVVSLGLWEIGRRMYAGETEQNEAGEEEEKEGLGMGDVKLIGALGAAMGFNAIPFAILWMFAGGFILALVAKVRGQTSLAFVPAITIGVAIYLFFDGRVLSWPPVG